MILNAERIYLRPLELNDAEIMLGGIDDKELMYMTGTKSTFTLEIIQNHIKRISQDDSRYDFAICLNETDEMIGEICLLDIDTEDRKAGFRISMNTIPLTGKGYGTEAIKALLKFAFETLELNRIQLEVFSHNKRAFRCYEKCGFIVEGVLRESLLWNDVYSDEIIMAILKSNYVRQV